MTNIKKYIVTRGYQSGYCIVCTFMDQYVNNLSIRDYLRSGLLCCCKCEYDPDEKKYTHTLCNNLTDEHVMCDMIDKTTTPRYTHSLIEGEEDIEDGIDIWYIEDIIRILLHYTDEDRKKANELLQIFLEDKSALWTTD